MYEVLLLTSHVGQNKRVVGQKFKESDRYFCSITVTVM